MDHDTQRCAICAAEFASSEELVRHERAHHGQQGSDTHTDEESSTAERPSNAPRQGRKFTRRNFE